MWGTQKSVRESHERLLARLRERQCLLLVTFGEGKWTTLLKVGEGWVLDRPGPQLFVIQQAYKSGQPCIILDAEKDPRLGEFGPHSGGFRSCLCLPLKAETGQFLGVLLLEDRERIQAFQPSDTAQWMSAVEPAQREMAASIPLSQMRAGPGSSPIIKVGLLGAATALLAWGLAARIPTPSPAPPSLSRLPSRAQASPEMVARSLVAALARGDFAGAQALSTLEGKVGAARFRSEAEKWMGDPRHARSLAFREVQKLAEKEDRCQLSPGRRRRSRGISGHFHQRGSNRQRLAMATLLGHLFETLTAPKDSRFEWARVSREVR